MNTRKKDRLLMVAGLIVIIVLLSTIVLKAESDNSYMKGSDKPIADVLINSGSIQWLPKISTDGIVLTILAPDGAYYKQTFSNNSTPHFELSDLKSSSLPDGSYTYEIRVIQKANKGIGIDRQDTMSSTAGHIRSAEVQAGYFQVKDGAILITSGTEPQNSKVQGTVIKTGSGDNTGYQVMDQVIADDEIVQGSLCVGLDCVNNESFGFDTIRLKENNTRIKFEDTSASAGFPTNDWQITANDSASGGGSYLEFMDIDNSRTPFRVMAGAPSYSLYVNSSGNIGLGTATPVLDLHVLNGNTPGFRLEQDGSGGYSPQTWDIAGNEANFFIRDITNGSKLPFRIQPGAPTSSLTIRSDGKIGIGTWSPTYPMELDTTGTNASFAIKRTDGATNYINATDSYANFGSVTNHPVRLVVNSAWRMRLETDNSITMANGATLTAGGTWTNASSRSLKENIQILSTNEAVEALNELNPVKYNYKADKSEKHVGFIAEDVPTLVATKDRKGLSPMDITAVLTKVMQELKKENEEQKKIISELQERITRLEKN